MAKPKIDEANRPRVHPDVDENAAEIHWTRPAPPPHSGDEVLVQRPNDAAEAVYVDGVWISPGELAYARKGAAREIKKK